MIEIISILMMMISIPMPGFSDCLFLLKSNTFYAICSYLPSITANNMRRIKNISYRLLFDDVENFGVGMCPSPMQHFHHIHFEHWLLLFPVNYAIAIQGLSIFSSFSQRLYSLSVVQPTKMRLLYEFVYFTGQFQPILPPKISFTQNLNADQKSKEILQILQTISHYLMLCAMHFHIHVSRRHHKECVRQDRYTNDVVVHAEQPKGH